MKKLITCLFGVSIAFSAAHALAQDFEYALTYSANDLATPEGVAALHTRIAKTARKHCPTYREIGSIKDAHACVDGVVSDLVSKVDHPDLTAYHRAGEQHQHR